jgi:hypothetical protein
VPFGAGGLDPDDTQRAAIETELARLEDAVDALSDLLLAESVHQVIKGSPAGAAATLETFAQGHRPPEPEVISAPRGGTVLHQRVALLFGDGAPPPEWGPVTPRAAAAPELNARLGQLFGHPAAITCRVTPEGGTSRPVSVGDLGLHPVDLLLLAQAAEPAGGHTELDHRIAWQVAGSTGPDRPVTVDYETAAGAGTIPMAAALELAAAAGRLLGFGRALAAQDLLPPERAGTSGDPMTAELTSRAAAAREALVGVRSALAAAGDPDGLRTALAAAAGLGVPGAFPASWHQTGDPAGTGLLAQAASTAAELGRRQDAADAADAGADASGVLGAVFGRALPVVPRFRPALPDLLAPALTTEPDLGPDAGATVEGWLAQLARVRAPVDAWREVRLLGRALGRVLPRPRIAQLPLTTSPGPTRWAGLTFGAEPNRPPSGLVSIALAGAQPPAADQPWAGLLLDTWPELVPSRAEDTGVAFQFGAPRAQAPQAVLLAVPPQAGGTWSYDVLERTLLGALELARVRAVDLSSLDALAQLLPMTFLAANRSNDAVSTSFAGLLIADAVIQGC